VIEQALLYVAQPLMAHATGACYVVGGVAGLALSGLGPGEFGLVWAIIRLVASRPRARRTPAVDVRQARTL